MESTAEDVTLEIPYEWPWVVRLSIAQVLSKRLHEDLEKSLKKGEEPRPFTRNPDPERCDLINLLTQQTTPIAELERLRDRIICHYNDCTGPRPVWPKSK